MSFENEAIRVEANNTISFGNYKVSEKIKVNDFGVNGDVYELRTHNQITRVQKNNSLLFESVPGCAIHQFHMDHKTIKFDIEGFENTQVTLELEPSKEYRIYIDQVNVGSAIAKGSGKVSFSIELSNTPQSVKVEKIDK